MVSQRGGLFYFNYGNMGPQASLNDLCAVVDIAWREDLKLAFSFN